VDPVVNFTVPGNPFLALPSRDGCWIFVSLVRTAEAPARIALLTRAKGALSLARELEVPTNATGMALTRDGTLLVVAAGPGVAFVDTAKLTAGADGALIGVWQDDLKGAGRVYVNVTRDGRYLFVSDESVQSISVLDIAGVRKSGIAGIKALGRIPTGRAPIALTFSADERYLFTTSQVTPQAGAPADCEVPNTKAGAPASRPQGAILVVDVARAVVEPAKSVVATVPAGCSPVRLVTSPQGDVAYVSARASNALLAFDTTKLVDDPANARIGAVPAGVAPVGVEVIDEGKRVVVTSSNRFAGDAGDRQVLTVIDATKIVDGAAAVLGTIPAGAFPRELRTTADGRTLLLTNFASKSVQMIDVARLPVATILP
jgi:DNA-binding beta-propeller fold protein YncE